jgi:hypothetical protein
VNPRTEDKNTRTDASDDKTWNKQGNARLPNPKTKSQSYDEHEAQNITRKDKDKRKGKNHDALVTGLSPSQCAEHHSHPKKVADEEHGKCENVNPIPDMRVSTRVEQIGQPSEQSDRG